MLTEYKLKTRIGALEPVIQLDNVSVRYRVPKEQIRSLKEYALKQLQERMAYKQFLALNDINMTIYRGEVVGVIGRNGAGKSTLLKVIARVLRPTRGRVRIKGQVAPLLSLGAGFDPELTGRENIYMNGMILGRSKQQLDERFDAVVEFAELETFIDAPVRTYSSGMMARLGFSIATDVQPDILIIDEILGVGDVAFRHKSSERIDEFCNGGATVLVVSHSMASIQRMCDRVIWLDKGHIRAMGPTAEIVRLHEDDMLTPWRGDEIVKRWETPEKLEAARKSGEAFDEYYFQYCCGQPYQRSKVWMRLFNSMADNIAAQLAPKTVMDAGCAKGFLVEALRARDIEAYGVDISPHAIAEMHEAMQPYCKRASITEPFDRRYDLIVCVEVLQNLTEEEGQRAIANFCQTSDDIIISVNPADRRAPTYVNVQPLEYWEQVFAQHGFVLDETVEIKFITPWAMRFRRGRGSA